ncbi:hypothetical protein REPUB_Repub08aG0231200 [Reevesia pubescens]
MAESAVNLVLEKLAAFFQKEMQLLRGDREDIAYVREELKRIKAFLRVADALEETDVEVKVWVKQIRDVAHDMEDIVDEYMLLLAHNHGEGLSGFLHKMSCCVRNMKARYRIASDIQGINSRIRDICEGHHRLRLKFYPDEGSSSNGVGNTWQDRRGDALLLDKADVVGIDESKKKLVGWLVDGGTDRKVISLSGMGGLGKTTLAKQVYDDTEVKKHFPVHAWITVSVSFKLEGLLKDMVEQLSRVISIPVPEGVDSMSSYQLKIIIISWLRKRRYLIILDDLWRINEWDAIKFALPANDCGSRVMLTTRNADLALSSRIESEGEVYNLEPLPPEESWTLFCRKTFRGNYCPPHLEEICKQILKKCAGLPLAIVAISGVLATKDKRRIDEWEMVGRSLGAEIDGNDKLLALKKLLSLSFNDLPYYLKSCFLYLSIFPEDHPIELVKLIRLWTAEGFVEVKQGKTQEEVAEDFFNELLNRSLIQVDGTTSDGRIKSCRIHDLLREIILVKSREQNFAVIAAKEQNATWPDKVRRLSIHNTLQNVLQNKFVSQLRSLFMFGVEENPLLNKLFPGGLRLLAVLDMQATPLTKFPTEVVNMYYLKYLSLRETKVTVVPRFIGKLLNLETLDLKHAYVTELPVEVLQLQRLRHLLVYRYEFESYDYFHSKYGFKGLDKIGELQSLQKLGLIEVNQGNVILAELGKLTQLRRLYITKLRKEDGKKLCSSIEKLTCLRSLSIISIEEDEIIDVQHLISPPPLLQRLYLRGRLETMPHWIRYHHSLVKVYLKWSRLMEDPLVSLQNLPNLVHLELVQVYDGDTLCFKSGGFKKLKRLGLDKCDELKWVQIQVGAMPCLEKLSIQRCKSMEKVPLGIEHLTKLNVLEFFDMPHELIRSLRQDEHGEDYWRVAHIPEVYSTYWRDGAWEVYSLESFVEGESSPKLNTVISSQDLHTRWK